MGPKFTVLTGKEIDRKYVTPSVGELVITSDSRRIYVGDGETPGGLNIAMNCGIFDSEEDMLGSTSYLGDFGFRTDEQVLYIAVALPVTELSSWFAISGGGIDEGDMETINTILADKADKVHAHTNYATRAELAEKANDAHTHSDLALKSELNQKADTEHTHTGYVSSEALAALAEAMAVGDESSLSQAKSYTDEQLTLNPTAVTNTVLFLTEEHFTGNVILKVDDIQHTTVVIPNGLLVSQPLVITRLGEGDVSIVGTETVSVVNVANGNSIAGRYGCATVLPVGNEMYVLTGPVSELAVEEYPDLVNGEIPIPEGLGTIVGDDSSPVEGE